MVVAPLSATAVGIALAFSPAAHRLGFAALPLEYFFILLGMIGIYLVLIEAAKSWLYRADNQPTRHGRTADERQGHRVRRRAERFGRHVSP
jgi:P-type Mg2+ transporter